MALFLFQLSLERAQAIGHWYAMNPQPTSQNQSNPPSQPISSLLGVLRNEKEAQAFAAGDKIFDQGEPASCLFYVLEGQVDILFNDREINSHQAGEVFGEMALIAGAPRSAKAVARTDCRLAVVGERRFLFLVQQHPFFALELMRVLVDRLRRSTST